ncbi:hypothetical protein SDC9_91618 [bioreactor metagenome]|uniref:Uncharacterized protein n=1 Tax=bioreactor metagenome TaxID=1076179 RepID=A0A644ZW51_9ZZZZ
MFGGCDFRFVEHLDAHRVGMVDERRKADQRLVALADFHQLGQLSKRPLLIAGIDLLLRFGGCAALLFGRGGTLILPRSWLRPSGIVRHRGCRLGLLFAFYMMGYPQRRQRLESAARLGAQLGLERAQVTALAHLATVFVGDAEVHEQMRAQHVELEVRALHIQ